MKYVFHVGLFVITVFGVYYFFSPVRIKIVREPCYTSFPTPIEDYGEPKTKEDFLAHAIITGDETKVRQLLDEGVSANAEAEIMWNVLPSTFLMLAVEYGREQTVSLLLEKGADIKATNSFGCSALNFAIDYDRANLISLLISNGVSLTSYTSWGNTPLLDALTKRQFAIADALIRNGADVNQKHASDGIFPIHLAVAERRPDQVKRLLDYGALIDNQSDGGVTALMIAAMSGHEDIVRLLLDRGASASISDKQNKTALTWARGKKHSACVKLLSNHYYETN